MAMLKVSENTHALMMKIKGHYGYEKGKVVSVDEVLSDILGSELKKIEGDSPKGKIGDSPTPEKEE